MSIQFLWNNKLSQYVTLQLLNWDSRSYLSSDAASCLNHVINTKVFKIWFVFRSGPWHPLLPDYWNLAQSSLLSQLSPNSCGGKTFLNSFVFEFPVLSGAQRAGSPNSLWNYLGSPCGPWEHLRNHHHVTYGSIDAQGLTFVVNIKIFSLLFGSWLLWPLKEAI